MQKIVFKRAVPFRTESGTILTDTIIAESDHDCPDGSVTIVAVLDHAKTIVHYSSKCVFSKNSIIRTEPFAEADLPKAV